MRHSSADYTITILSYDRGMPVSVTLQTVHPRKLAAVRRQVMPGAVGSAWGTALDKVWEFIRNQPGLRTDGHNIFLYTTRHSRVRLRCRGNAHISNCG